MDLARHYSQITEPISNNCGKLHLVYGKAMADAAESAGSSGAMEAIHTADGRVEVPVGSDNPI